MKKLLPKEQEVEKQKMERSKLPENIFSAKKGEVKAKMASLFFKNGTEGPNLESISLRELRVKRMRRQDLLCLFLIIEEKGRNLLEALEKKGECSPFQKSSSSKKDEEYTNDLVVGVQEFFALFGRIGLKRQIPEMYREFTLNEDAEGKELGGDFQAAVKALLENLKKAGYGSAMNSFSEEEEKEIVLRGHTAQDFCLVWANLVSSIVRVSSNLQKLET